MTQQNLSQPRDVNFREFYFWIRERDSTRTRLTLAYLQPQQLLAVPHSSRKNRDSLSPLKLEYQAVEIFQGEMRALTSEKYNSQAQEFFSSLEQVESC